MTKIKLIFTTIISSIAISCSSMQQAQDISPQFIEFEGRPFDIAIADLKGNSAKDILLIVKYSGLHIVNIKNGFFESSSLINDWSLMHHPLDLDTGDFNADGITDIAYVTENGIQLLINTGSGAFFDASTKLSSPHMSFNLKVLDLNGDGVSDIIAGGTLDDKIFIHLSRSPLNYDLITIKPKSLNDSTPFSMQQMMTVAYRDNGYPTLLIPEFQNSVLWLLTYRGGKDFTASPIYVKDFNSKIQYAQMLTDDSEKAYIAVAAGTFNPTIDIIGMDKRSKSSELIYQIPLPKEFGTPVHIEPLKQKNESDNVYKLIVTSYHGITLVSADISSSSSTVTRIFSIPNSFAVMSIKHPEQGLILTATQKQDGIWIIPFSN